MHLIHNNNLPSSPLLELRHLDVGYKNELLSLGNSSVNAHRGETIALLGRNGCGKTTLLRTIAGLQAALRGDILINGTPLSLLPRPAKARLVAYAPTRHAHDSHIRVEELVMLARFPHQGWFNRTTAQDHRAVANALELSETTRFAHRPIGTLSDGEQQRVWLAMALAQDTPILLLDEPSAFLDFPAKGNLVTLLHAISRTTQRLIIYSTHDLQSALWRSDRLWIVQRNTLCDAIPEAAAQDGTLNDVFGTASNQFDPRSFTFMPTFQMQPQHHCFYLETSPDDRDALFAQRLLQRLGWRQEASSEASGAVKIAKAPNGASWRLPNGEYANSLEELARWAKNYR